MSTAGVLVLIGIIGALCATMMSLAGNAMNQGGRAAEYFQARALAETAVHTMYAKIRDDMTSKGEFSLALSTTTLNHGGTSGNAAGTYEGKVLDMKTSSEDYSSGGDRVRKTTYNFELEGVGRARYGITSKMQAKFDALIEHNLAKKETVTKIGEPPQQMYYPIAAMSANERIKIKTDGKVTVKSGDPGKGHVLANDGIEWQEPSGDKTKHGNDKLIEIDGQFVVNKDAKAFTEGAAGLGNPSGAKNYSSPASEGGDADQVLVTDSRVPFADSAVVAAWKSRWIAASTSTGANLSATTLNTGSIAASGGLKTLSTPMYIEGDLEIAAGDIVKLFPTSSNPAKNFIYVRGNIKNLGKIQNLGVKIVTEGTYTESSSSSYEVTESGSPFPTQQKVLQNSALISTKEAKDAIQFRTDKSATVGLVYSTLGGIDVKTKAKEIKGVLVAGGTSGNGGITVETDSEGKLDVDFLKDATIPGEIDISSLEKIDTSYVVTSVRSSFVATPLKEWVEFDQEGKPVNTRTSGADVDSRKEFGPDEAVLDPDVFEDAKSDGGGSTSGSSGSGSSGSSGSSGGESGSSEEALLDSLKRVAKKAEGALIAAGDLPT